MTRTWSRLLRFGAICVVGLGAVAKADPQTRIEAEKGVSLSQNLLGCQFETGQSEIQNYELAGYWYLKAANQGLAVAEFNLGVLNISARAQLPFDARENAITLFRRSAEKGLLSSILFVAVMYEEGIGIEPDLSNAHTFYLIASSLGSVFGNERKDIVEKKLRFDQVKNSQQRALKWMEENSIVERRQKLTEQMPCRSIFTKTESEIVLFVRSHSIHLQ
jgi:hypothetical protein